MSNRPVNVRKHRCVAPGCRRVAAIRENGIFFCDEHAEFYKDDFEEVYRNEYTGAKEFEAGL